MSQSDLSSLKVLAGNLVSAMIKVTNKHSFTANPKNAEELAHYSLMLRKPSSFLWLLGGWSLRTHQHLPEAISNTYVELFPLSYEDEPTLRHLAYLVQHGLVCGPDPHLLEPQPKPNVGPTIPSTQSSQDLGDQRVTLGRHPSLSGYPQEEGTEVVEVGTLGTP